MEIAGQYIFNFDQAAVWKILMTPAAIATAIPGVREMLPVEDETDTYRLVSKLNGGGLHGMLDGVIRLTEIEAPHRYRLLLNGEALQRKLNGSARLELQPVTPETHSQVNPDLPIANPIQTRVRWVLEVHSSDDTTTGEFTRGLIQMGAAVLSKQFFNTLARQLETNTI